MQEFADSHFAYKYASGSHSLSMMQTVTPDLVGGFEAMWHPQIKDFVFSYGMKYTKDFHTILAQYIPISRKDSISIGYVTRPSNKINLFTELKGSLDGVNESIYGMRLRFNSGQVTGTISSKFRMTSSIMLIMESMILVKMNTLFSM